MSVLRKRKPRAIPGGTLFPFLSVLMCTCGIMCFLLVALGMISVDSRSRRVVLLPNLKDIEKVFVVDDDFVGNSQNQKSPESNASDKKTRSIKGKQFIQPLFIECRIDSVRILDTDDVVKFVGNDRRYDSKLPAALEDAISLVENGKKKYVILLVRPEGVSMYKWMIQVLKTRNIRYGFEAVLDEWELIPGENFQIMNELQAKRNPNL